MTWEGGRGLLVLSRERPGMLVNILQGRGQPPLQRMAQPQCQRCHGGETPIWRKLAGQCLSGFLCPRPAPFQRHTCRPDHPRDQMLPRSRRSPCIRARPLSTGGNPLVGASSSNFNPGEEPSPKKSLMVQHGLSRFFLSAKNGPL